jgi:hypothetical protein
MMKMGMILTNFDDFQTQLGNTRLIVLCIIILPLCCLCDIIFKLFVNFLHDAFDGNYACVACGEH